MKQESVVVALNISFIAVVWILSICLFFKLKGRLWSVDKGGAAKDVALPAAWLSHARGNVRILLAYRTTVALYCLGVCIYTWFNRVSSGQTPRICAGVSWRIQVLYKLEFHFVGKCGDLICFLFLLLFH